jgi:microcystin-dependent protein
MSQPFLAEIKIISWNFAPKGWAFCNGQFLPINQNQALFSILGTTYGGNGQTTFALPDFRDRVPFHVGNGHILGERGGEDAHTITTNEMPTHLHQVSGSNANTGLQVAPTNNVWSTSTQNPFETSANSAMNPGTIANTGGSQPHQNTQPYLVLNFIIALQGIFPSRN